jgi:hypothetical protein
MEEDLKALILGLAILFFLAGFLVLWVILWVKYAKLFFNNKPKYWWKNLKSKEFRNLTLAWLFMVLFAVLLVLFG